MSATLVPAINFPDLSTSRPVTVALAISAMSAEPASPAATCTIAEPVPSLDVTSIV
jgi:hypothetical protein